MTADELQRWPTISALYALATIPTTNTLPDLWARMVMLGAVQHLLESVTREKGPPPMEMREALEKWAAHVVRRALKQLRPHGEWGQEIVTN